MLTTLRLLLLTVTILSTLNNAGFGVYSHTLQILVIFALLARFSTCKISSLKGIEVHGLLKYCISVHGYPVSVNVMNQQPYYCKMYNICTLYDVLTRCPFISCIEPAKVHSVTAVPVRPSDIQKDHIDQTISWEIPDNHKHITHYLIQYGAGITSRENGGNTLSAVNSTTYSAVLSIPANATTYSVWVTAVSEAGQGEFSDREDFNYSSKWLKSVNILYIYYNTNHYTPFTCSTRYPYYSQC